MKFPGCDRSILAHAALDFDHSGGAKVRPGELLFASPDEFDRFARGFRQSRSLDSGFARMFSAITRTGIRYDHSYAIFGDSKSRGQFAADAEGPLGSGPNRELAVFPLRHGGARFQRRVRDVSHSIGSFEFLT